MVDENTQGSEELTEEQLEALTAPTAEPKLEEPVVEPVVETPPPPPASTPAPTVVNTPKKETPQINQSLIDGLNAYVEAMQPGKSHQGNSGAAHQVKFYRLIQATLRRTGGDFTRSWTYLLSVVNEHRKSVFHEMYVYRYFNQIPQLSVQERRNFERIINLLITTCNPANRAKSLTQVDISATMSGFRDPDMQQRVVGYYTTV